LNVPEGAPSAEAVTAADGRAILTPTCGSYGIYDLSEPDHVHAHGLIRGVGREALREAPAQLVRQVRETPKSEFGG